MNHYTVVMCVEYIIVRPTLYMNEKRRVYTIYESKISGNQAASPQHIFP